MRLLLSLCMLMGGGLLAVEGPLPPGPVDDGKPLVSVLTLGDSEPWSEDARHGRLQVRIRDQERPLAVRAIVTAADGSQVDGSGHGNYSDGRFFADGEFTVVVPPGRTRLHLRCGPEYVPLITEVDITAGRRVSATVVMQRWFSPHDLGWYDGDNHVHAQHDANAVVRTDLAYTALQGRADGLAYLTEAGSERAVAFDDLASLSTPTFLLRVAGEIRPGPFLGHFNPAGIREPIAHGLLEELTRTLLPHHAIGAEVRRRGGVLIHTHPSTPPHQMHWMGASILMADAVMGTTVEALDQDHPSSMALWFTALNLGNRIAASGSTDAALGRKSTPSPGDRRVYSHADAFTYEAIIDGIRRGRTVASNGGPLFLTMTVDGRGIGEELILADDSKPRAAITLHALDPLRRVVLYVNGVERWSGEVAGRRGHLVLEAPVTMPTTLTGWCVARVESQSGDWAMTSPIYFHPASSPPLPAAAFTLLQISNATRYAALSRSFHAHLLVTVRSPEELLTVDLLRDDERIHRFSASEADERHEGRIAVTQPFGTYGPGWAWHRPAGRAIHLQADWPITVSGWYTLRAQTSSGRVLVSDAVQYDVAESASHQIGVARVDDGATRFDWWGYGQEAPLTNLPEGDHWWYPQKTFWQMRTRFDGTAGELTGGDRALAAKFRATVGP